MARPVYRMYGRLWRRSLIPRLLLIFVAKEHVAMALSGFSPLRRGRATRWLAVAAVVSAGALIWGYWVPLTATAAVPAVRGVTILPDGRPVQPAGIRYNLGDFSIGLAVSPDGRCAASS